MAQLPASVIRRIATALLWLVAMSAGPAFAQASDMSIEAVVTPAGPLAPGTTALITLTFRNQGPNDAVGVVGVSSSYWFLIGGQFDLVTSLPNACPVQYDDFVGPPGVPGESFLVAGISVGNIPVGGSRVCTLSLFVYPEARGPNDLSFRVDAFTPDPNAANDNVALGLVFAQPSPRAIPATDTLGLALLALGLLAAAAVVRKHAPR